MTNYILKCLFIMRAFYHFHEMLFAGPPTNCWLVGDSRQIKKKIILIDNAMNVIWQGSPDTRARASICQTLFSLFIHAISVVLFDRYLT